MAAPAPGRRAGAAALARTRPVRGFLRVPLFYKILLANVAIVLAGAVGGTILTAELVRADPSRSAAGLVGVFAAVGVLASALANALILRLALSPLTSLERTAAAVQAGELDTRAPVSPVADRELERLTRTFNAMLDGLERTRRRLRDVASRAIRAQEEERKRIARELHDETAQRLAALLVHLRLARGIPDAAARAEVLDAVRDEIADTLEGIRRYARGLRPPALEDLGLVAAVEGHARTLAEATGLSVQVVAERIEAPLEPDVELTLYRVVQEALSNVVRHADATRAVVRIAREADRLVVEVEDDGAGFDVDQALAGEARGLGLFGMQERAGYVGGTLDVRSAPGEGTRVRIEAPAEGPGERAERRA